ncbi:unnamed protein product [Cuscuta europaea]|uniref:Uncharacterized protein n=1 Tax=Cuscuta europaea TaxID=41803 RepID=A0A9P0YHS7_CUSEU|nr:unnamed protein product [Cuscuta europaea]
MGQGQWRRMGQRWWLGTGRGSGGGWGRAGVAVVAGDGKGWRWQAVVAGGWALENFPTLTAAGVYSGGRCHWKIRCHYGGVTAVVSSGRRHCGGVTGVKKSGDYS